MMFFFFFFKAEAASDMEDELAGERLAAAVKVMQYIQAYRKDGILARLTDRILKKKLAWIQKAHTKAELAEIVKPSVPHYSGAGFSEGKYHVREEELILWSKASLIAPLNHAGYERYMELFGEFFPNEAAEILKNKCAAERQKGKGAG